LDDRKSSANLKNKNDMNRSYVDINGDKIQ